MEDEDRDGPVANGELIIKENGDQDGYIIPSAEEDTKYQILEGAMDGNLPVENPEYRPSYSSTYWEPPPYRRQRGMKKYAKTWKAYQPLRLEKRPHQAMPVDHCSLYATLSYSWLTGLMWKAYRHGIQPQQLYSCSPMEACYVNSQRFEYIWKDEIARKGVENVSMAKVVWRFTSSRLIPAIIVLMIGLTIGFIVPTVLLRAVLTFADNKDAPLMDGLLLVLYMFILEVSRSIVYALLWGINYRTALRLRGGCMALVYRKILRVKSLGDKSIGELINLISNDGTRLFDLITFGPLVLGGPYVAIVGTAYICWILGPSGMVGFTVFLLFYPIQYCLTKVTIYLRRKTVNITDQRVRLMNELLTCVKLIKLYAWEIPFSRNIADVRCAEKQLLEKAGYVQSLSVSIAPSVSIVAAVATFMVYVALGNNLTPAQVFPCMTAWYFYAKEIGFCAAGFKAIGEAVVTFRRIKSILLMPDDATDIPAPPEDATYAVKINNGTFAWPIINAEAKKEDQQNHKQTKDGEGKNEDWRQHDEDSELRSLKKSAVPLEEKAVSHINLTIPNGQLVGICGPVGSGKSALLSAVLGQMSLLKGSLEADPSISYVSQQAWILNTTLKENILFGEDFDSKRYYEALYCSGLTSDIKALPEGDETEVGERGVTLSGGQKQRVSIARALYTNRNLVLLDDPMSAVDAHVGKFIFTNAVQKALKEKTVMFVSHQLQYMQFCDWVVYMKDGQIAEQGTHDQLMNASQEYAMTVRTFLNQHRELEMETVDLNSVSTPNHKSPDKKPRSPGSKKSRSPDSESDDGSIDGVPIDPQASKIIKGETAESGAISWSTYGTYVSAAGGFFVCFIVVTKFIINLGSAAFSSWWLSYWISQGGGSRILYNETADTNETIVSHDIRDHPDFEFYRTIYGLTVVVIVLSSLTRGFFFVKMTLRASSVLHNRLFASVFQSKMSFFDTTPLGRIINLFSKDIDEIDVRLPFTIEMLLQNIFIISFSLLFVAMAFPMFLIALFFLAIVFIFLHSMFRAAVRQLKRIENIIRSPVYSHVGTTVHGLPVIKAYRKQNQFIQRFTELYDTHTAGFYQFQCAMRWLALRLDLLSVVIVVTTGLLIVIMRGSISPAFAGLALAYATQLTGMFQFTIRLGTEAEARFTSVERIEAYIKKLEHEELSVVERAPPPSNWPANGAVEFTNVKMKYRAGLPLVLKNVSFKTGTHEKIGIVGRTGAGKSSLLTALFRLAELQSGTISIDGIDIGKLKLKDLRSRISVIPQDPVLFIGTVRYNLDPFNDFDDEDIWRALESICMKTKISGMQGQLDAQIIENGDNLSVGERQLLCMARAILRNSKILVMDEATASVDADTDSKIQQTIHNSFSDCTVLTIAHRIQTIVNYDRILVINRGKIAEFDKPDVLLANPNSMFSKICSSAQM